MLKMHTHIRKDMHIVMMLSLLRSPALPDQIQPSGPG